MIEKVNASHPDKVADRIGGAIVDLAYRKQDNPKVAVEILIGHGVCTIITETSVALGHEEVEAIVKRIADNPMEIRYLENAQDIHLAHNQKDEPRWGDNCIFKGIPTNEEEKYLSEIARYIYNKYPTDGKYIYDQTTSTLIVCQSNAKTEELTSELKMKYPNIDKIIVNPLGDWTGGTDVDTGAINRKLGSDMGRAVSGGGIVGKDCSKADVSVNIVCHLIAQEYQKEVSAFCAIGDDTVVFNIKDNGSIALPFKEIVKRAKEYIDSVGGFEKFSEWGLI